MAALFNTVPIYPGSVLSAPLNLAVANTARDGSGVLNLLVQANAAATAAGKGAIVQRINVVSAAAIGASTAMVCRLWRVSAGAVITLEDEVALVTATTSNTVVGTRTVFNRTNILLAPGEALKVTQSIAEAVAYCAEYGEY